MAGVRGGQVVVDLGKFDSEEAAARAHDRAAVWCLGLTATTNFPAADWALQVCALARPLESGQNSRCTPCWSQFRCRYAFWRGSLCANRQSASGCLPCLGNFSLERLE